MSWWRRTPVKVEQRLGMKLLDAHQTLNDLNGDERIPPELREDIIELQAKLMNVYEQRIGV